MGPPLHKLGKKFLNRVLYYLRGLFAGSHGAGSCIQEGSMSAENNSTRVPVIHAENRPDDSVELNHWLRELILRRGSDLLLVPNAPASIRMEGVVSPIGDRPLTGE